VSWVEVLLTTGAAVTAVTVIGAALWRVVRVVVRLVRLLDGFLRDWNGAPERPGAPAQPGVMERPRVIDARLDRLSERLAAVEQASVELLPQGTSTLADRVGRIEREVCRG